MSIVCVTVRRGILCGDTYVLKRTPSTVASHISMSHYVCADPLAYSLSVAHTSPCRPTHYPCTPPYPRIECFYTLLCCSFATLPTFRVFIHTATMLFTRPTLPNVPAHQLLVCERCPVQPSGVWTRQLRDVRLSVFIAAFWSRILVSRQVRSCK
jgi:hypothetical protein